jgi:hypothetical protein
VRRGRSGDRRPGPARHRRRRSPERGRSPAPGRRALPGTETWTFRLGEDDDARWPFAREITRGVAAAEIALVRRAGRCEEVMRSGRFRVTRWYAGTLRWALFVAAEWPGSSAA